jgi:hypothetical protein
MTCPTLAPHPHTEGIVKFSSISTNMVLSTVRRRLGGEGVQGVIGTLVCSFSNKQARGMHL